MNREEVVNTLRACLLSAKGGIKLDDLHPDYKTIIGENIPFQRLGYPSLDAFLRSVPGIRIVSKGGIWYAEAQPTEDTVHISKLISHQKSSKGPKKARKKMGGRNQMPFRQPNHIKKTIWPSRSFNDNYTSSANKVQGTMKVDADYKTGRQNGIPSLMQLPLRCPVSSNNGKPRYMQHEVILNSPSKRLKETQANFVLPSSQSVNRHKDTPLLKNDTTERMSVISRQPKTVLSNVEFGKRNSTNISERLKVNHSLSTDLTPHNDTTSHTMQSEILSPLSPAQLITRNNNTPDPSVSFASPSVINKIVPKLYDVHDPRNELVTRVNMLNLSQPVYKILPTKMKNSAETAIYAQVKIGTRAYSSYPAEARSEDEAQKLAAKAALDELTLEKYGPFSNVAETTDINLIKERVLTIIDTYTSGVFMNQIPALYKQQYKESLPQNWIKVIEDCPTIMQEKGANNSTILRRFVLHSGKTSGVSLPRTDKVQLSPIGPVVPEQLQLPKEEFWVVYVTYITSITDIWVRLIGDDYSEKFDAITAAMTEYYHQNTRNKARTIEIGNYYAVFEDNSWHRVRCIDYDSTTEMTTVMFIDHGDEDSYHHDKLHILDKKFCILPAQAMRMSLAGLEDFDDCKTILSYIEECFLGHSFYVEVTDHHESEDGPFATVVFYDTSGPDDINLNKIVSKKILEIFAASPKLDGQVNEVFISHVEENGDIYVQVQSESMKCLVNSLNRLIHTGLNAEDLDRSVVSKIDTTKVYFVSVDGNWYRGKVADICSNNQLKMFLMDFGKTVTVGKANLLALENLSEMIAKYPSQALKVQLHNIEKSMFNEKMVTRLKELAPSGEPLLIKVINEVIFNMDNCIPVVELFKRIKPNNLLVSINNTLAYEDKLSRSIGDGNNNIKPKKRVERTISRIGMNEDCDVVKSLKPPKISNIGEYFDVHVTMAAHPGNFTVQPLVDKSSLKAMMIQLQESCSLYNGPHPTTQTVKEGKLYAGKYTDDIWYRVCISNVISEDTVTVYLCDYGDVCMLTLNKLQPLKSQFLELPYQAIKAKLVGIKPAGIDWLVEDTIRFQELVVERNFVSIVVEFSPDKLSPADTVLGLKLIDTETADDIYIDQLLVQEGRATFI